MTKADIWMNSCRVLAIQTYHHPLTTGFTNEGFSASLTRSESKLMETILDQGRPTPLR